jgi:hypothetical protein
MTQDRASSVTMSRRRSPQDIFQIVSYLQYPFMLVAMGYTIKPMVTGFATYWDDTNYALLYAGIGIGLSSLQDPTKVQNELSRKVWQHPRRGKAMLVAIAVASFGMIVVGLISSYFSETNVLEQLSMGLVAFGIGMFGLLKTAIDMFEHHRLDKNTKNVPTSLQETEE